jgi:GTP cyclohydrolase IA
MSERVILTHEEVAVRALEISHKLRDRYREKPVCAFAVPRGGIPAAYRVQCFYPQMYLANNIEEADIIIDDVIDSGRTRSRFISQDGEEEYGFYALYDKQGRDKDLGWIVFPWEQLDPTADTSDNIVRLIESFGEDPNREGLQKTPERVARAWQHWCGGYRVDTGGLLTTFADGSEHYDEMVLVRNLPFYSHCEHHLAPFFGVAHIAYIPEGRIIGLSKIPRLLDAFARRLQVQERLTQQVAEALWTALAPKGVAVMITARHLCMESRGIQQQGHNTTTTALRGVFKENAAARAEFLSSVK